MEAEPLNAAATKRTRRWYQFSLRTLMIFVLIVAIPCAWVGRRVEQKRFEREAVNAIESVGGHAWYDYQYIPPWARMSQEVNTDAEPSGPAWLRLLVGNDFFSEVDSVNLDRSAAKDADLAALKNLACLRVLDLHKCNITDAGLENVGELTYLEELSLSGTKITGAGLERLKNLTALKKLSLWDIEISDAEFTSISSLIQLESLDLNSTRLTDAGLEKLGTWTQLTALTLHSTGITDAGLALLKSLHRLEMLDLSGTNVSDAGVETLKSFAHLRYLNLYKTRVTKAASDELRRLWPECSFCTTQ